MSVLDSVLRYKAEKEAQQAQAAQAIPNAVMAFMQGRQEQRKNMIDMLQIDATLAAKGLRRTPYGFVRDESLADPVDNFIKQGQMAQAYNNMIQAGVIAPSGGGSGGPLLTPSGQLNVPQGQPQANPQTVQQAPQQPTQDQNNNDLFATGATLNAAGVATSTDVKSEEGMRRELAIKGKEEKAKKIGLEEGKQEFGAEKGATGSMRFVQQYERSYDEIQKKVPGFGETSIAGKVKRIGASVLNQADLLPETATLAKRSKATANQMARDVEGGRVTDQDRQVYADTLVGTLSAPSNENARLASEQLIGFADQGADISKNIVALSGSKNPTLKKIYGQVIEQYPEYKVVKVKDSESGEVRVVTLAEARRLRGAK